MRTASMRSSVSIHRGRSRARSRSLRYSLVVSALLLASACEDPKVVMPADQLSLVARDSVVEADGVSASLIQAALPRSLPQDASIEFVTTLGRLIPPSGAPDRKATVRARGGRAEVLLVSSGETGTAFVSATGVGSAVQTSVRLAPAPAHFIELIVDRMAAPADGKTAITATALLKRNSGAVTAGLPVQFIATDSMGSTLPALSGTVIADGSGVARYPLTSTVPGIVILQAVAGSIRSDARQVRLTPVPPGDPS
jgi:Bacterial Ig-like domain (group 1)